MFIAPPKITLSYMSNLFILYDLPLCSITFRESVFFDISSNSFCVISEMFFPFIDFKGSENIPLKTFAL